MSGINKNWIKPKEQSHHGDDLLMNDMWQISKSKQDMEAVKRAIEEIAGMHREPIFTIEEVQQARKAVSEQIKKLQNDLEKYDELVKFMDELPFKEGDAAFHKDHGNVFVSGVVLNETVQNSTYSVVLKTGRKLQVKTDELMPISEATKVLFGKK